MRKFKFTLIAFMAAMMALSFTACSDDDPEPNPNPDPEVNEDNYHFDLFVTVDKHGGVSRKNNTIVHSVQSFAAEPAPDLSTAVRHPGGETPLSHTLRSFSAKMHSLRQASFPKMHHGV